MQFYIIVNFLGHMARVFAVDAFGPTIGTHHGNGFNFSHLPIPSTNGTLLPGYHRNVSAGAAWVLPASRTDLGARAMSCECFDPDGKYHSCIEVFLLLPRQRYKYYELATDLCHDSKLLHALIKRRCSLLYSQGGDLLR